MPPTSRTYVGYPRRRAAQHEREPVHEPRRRTMLVGKHQVKDEDGVPCYIYKMPNQMLVKVGSGSSGDTFQLKDAEWADVNAQP